MKIGIIGAGNIGGALGTLWAKAGHQVLFSSRNVESLGALVAKAGANATSGTPVEAAQFGEVILLAIPYTATGETLTPEFVNALKGKVLMDARNPYKPDGSGIETFPEGETATRQLAKRLPGVHVVKVFNTLYWKTLVEQNHLAKNDRLTIPLAGEDGESKQAAATLIEDAGFTLLDVGSLHSSGAKAMEPGEALYNIPLTLPEARAIVETL